jgi:thioredoxin reductase (NADPH)
VVIIGAGPAGLAAAIQLSRQGQEFVLFERDKAGGLLLNANLVENYPGFVDGISGPDLVELFKRQAERLGVEIHQEEVKEVSLRADLFRIVTDQRELASKYLVAATGTKPKTLPRDELSGVNCNKVFTEVYPLIREEGKQIIILGAGDAALDYSLNLAKKNKVILLNRGSRIKGLGLLWERVQKTPSIDYFSDQNVERIIDAEGGRIMVTTSIGTQRIDHEADYLITAIGREPELGFAQGEFQDKIEGLRSEGKLYFIGDLHNGSYRQTSMAVGDGIKAAMSIGRKLEEG